MKKITLLLLLTVSYFAHAQEPYYSDVDLTLTGNALYLELQSKISSNVSTTFTYGDNRDTLKTTDDEDFNDTDGSDTSTTVRLIYGYNDSDGSCTTDRTRHEDNFGGTTCDYNREHTYARSLPMPDMGSVSNSSTGIGADPHNIRSADQQMNGNKASKLFTDGSGNAQTISGNWYPGDEWKGDVARIIMYMYTRYGDQCKPEYTGVGAFQAGTEMLQLFLQWNVDDPVSPYEYQRNEYLETVYGNRNPFIDNPYFATLIWGGPDAEDTWNTLGIEDEEKTSLKIYPNPTNGSPLFINTGNVVIKKITLFSINGKQVFEKMIDNHQSTIRINENKTLSNGMYLLKVETTKSTFAKKIIIN